MDTRTAAGLAGVLLAGTVAALAQPASAQPAVDDLARWVNPFVGTKPGGADHGTGGGAGNTFPGADVPFGMVQWSPDTVTHQHGGYFYDDNGLPHVWPTTELGEPDNAVSYGQSVTLPAAPPGATRLALLGGAANGKASGELTIAYTDGSTQVAEVGFSGWTLGGGGQPVSFDNRIAIRTPYRNSVGGSSQYLATYVFATAPITLSPGKQIRSVTLPATTEGGTLHVFAITAG